MEYNNKEKSKCPEVEKGNKLANLLISKLQAYFNEDKPSSEKWKEAYRKQIQHIAHDEPWLTLVSIYAIFGEKSTKNNEDKLNAINQIFANSGTRNPLQLDEIIEIRLEEQLREILEYREELKKTFEKDNFHLYPDIRDKICKKLEKESSFEGNTNLDLKIIGKQNGVKKVIFIEAKFLSDISYKITYNPVRDQIIRNIDAGIDLIKNDKAGKNEIVNFKDFYFLLLTPQIFRPSIFGEIKKSAIDKFNPRNSRLYCYKMREYLDYQNLKRCLPHRDLSDKEWMEISNNIGWITFEDFFKYSILYSTIEDNEKNLIEEFFKERNLCFYDQK